MNAIEVLDLIRRAGGKVWSDGNELRLRVPTGLLAPEHKAVLVEHKAVLVPLLARSSEPAIDDDKIDAEECAAVSWERSLTGTEAAVVVAKAIAAWEEIAPLPGKDQPEPALDYRFVDSDVYARGSCLGCDFCAPDGARLRGPAPAPPPGARLYFQDADARPCSAAESYRWTWEHGPEWVRSQDYPPPCLPQATAGYQLGEKL